MLIHFQRLYKRKFSFAALSFDKGIIVFFLICLVSFTSSSQFGGCYTSQQLQEEFLTTKTLVLLTGDEIFDEQFKSGMEKYWKHTEFRFVEREELNTYVFNTDYTILKPYNEKHASSNGSLEYSMMGLFFTESFESQRNPLIASALIDELNTEKQVVDARHRAAHIPKFINDFIRLRLSGELEPSCAGVKSEYIDYYNESNVKFKDKTLYINENYLNNRFTQEAISDVYKAKFKIASPQEITDGIESELEDACYLLSISAYGKYTFIIDFETGDILYAISHINGIGLNKRDFDYINLKLK
jgi:hypothetical protein